MSAVITFFSEHIGQHKSFSNWHRIDLTIPANSYYYEQKLFVIPEHKVISTEQSMMYAKEVLFGLKEGHDSVLTITSDVNISVDDNHKLQAKIKNFGGRNGSILNFDNKIWAALRYSIVKHANWTKFTTDLELQNILLETGTAVIAEASPYDKIWGIGLKDSNVNKQKIQNQEWCGQNLLGKLLMEIRDSIRQMTP